MTFKLKVREATPSDIPGNFYPNAKLTLKVVGPEWMVMAIYNAITQAVSDEQRRN